MINYAIVYPCLNTAGFGEYRIILLENYVRICCDFCIVGRHSHWLCLLRSTNRKQLHNNHVLLLHGRGLHEAISRAVIINTAHRDVLCESPMAALFDISDASTAFRVDDSRYAPRRHFIFCPFDYLPFFG